MNTLPVAVSFTGRVYVEEGFLNGVSKEQQGGVGLQWNHGHNRLGVCFSWPSILWNWLGTLKCKAAKSYGQKPYLVMKKRVTCFLSHSGRGDCECGQNHKERRGPWGPCQGIQIILKCSNYANYLKDPILWDILLLNNNTDSTLGEVVKSRVQICRFHVECNLGKCFDHFIIIKKDFMLWMLFYVMLWMLKIKKSSVMIKILNQSLMKHTPW